MSDDMGSGQRDSQQDLYVEIEIRPAAGEDCLLSEFADRVDEISHQLVGDECHADIELRSEECSCLSTETCTEVVHATTEVGPSCPCAILGAFGCVAEPVDVADGRIRIETYVPNRDKLATIVDELSAAVESLHLRQLKRIDAEDSLSGQGTVTLDLAGITEKQREAVTKAVAAGYYCSPRETSLADLSDDLDISKSALSQRLNAVESKLATAAFAQSPS